MSATREQIAIALLNLLKAAVQPLLPTMQISVSRRLKTAENVKKLNQPAIFMKEHDTKYESVKGLPPKRTWLIYLVIYARIPKDEPDMPGGSILNPIIDAIETAMETYTGMDVGLGYLTLGGLVDRCFISGDIIVETGEVDADNQAIAVIPVSILMP